MLVTVVLVVTALFAGTWYGKKREKSRLSRHPKLVALSLVSEGTLVLRRWEHVCGRMLEDPGDECLCESRIAGHALYKITTTQDDRDSWAQASR